MCATPALAAGGEATGSSLGTVVLLILSVGAAYLLTHFVVDRMQQRFLLITGVEYVLLGLMLGPAVPAIPAFADIEPLSPIVALGAGWVGLIYGANAHRETLRTQHDGDFIRIGLVDATGTGLVVGAVMYWLLTAGVPWLNGMGTLASTIGPAWLLGDPLVAPDHTEALVCAVFVGCAAAARSNSAVDLLTARYKLQGGLPDALSKAGIAGDLLAIVVFGLIFCFWHTGETQIGREVVWGEWVLLTQGLGLGLGLMFSQFIGRDESTSDNNAFLALVGIIAFASGAAYHLNLSPLVVNLLLAAVLVNTTRYGRELARTLHRTARPARLVLLVFAGALLVQVPLVQTACVTVVLVLVRLFAKLIVGRLATRGTSVRADLGRGTLAQGDVAIAMALSFRIAYTGPGADLAYTAVVMSVILNEFVAPRLLKGLLVDAGEIRTEQQRVNAEVSV